MDKYLKYAIIAFLSLVVLSCSDSEDKIEDDISNGYARFSKTEVTVPSKGGLSSAVIVWDNVEWEIEMSDGESFLSDIKPLSGGGVGSSDLTTITFTVSENSSSNQRVQDIYVIDKKSGEKEKIQITQETLPKTAINPNIKYQEVVGFGGMYNPSIWLSTQDRISSEELATMYDPDGQLQYSILRLMIYPDKSRWAGDVAGALQAQSYGAVIFACPWHIDAVMADEIVVNGETHDHLPAENYEAYTNHLIEYIKFMKSEGVNLYAISVQNEPDMHFTYWTPEEIATYTAQYGGIIRETGVKLMSPEACGFSPEWTDAVMNSTEAFANTDIVAGHTYQGFTDLSSSYVAGRHDYVCSLYPNKLGAVGKTWWMTEKLFNEGESENDLNKQEYKKWSYNLEHLALEMHMCMEGYCSAYVYWYLKRFYGMIGDNDSRGFVAEGEVMKNGYIMGHYSAYATGMTRVDIAVSDPDVLATAYVNETKDVITVVALNMGYESYETLLQIPSEVAEVIAIETTEEYNMKEKGTVLNDDLKHIRIEISPRSINSVQITL